MARDINEKMFYQNVNSHKHLVLIQNPAARQTNNITARK